MAEIVRAKQNFIVDRKQGQITVTYYAPNQGIGTFILVLLSVLCGMATILLGLVLLGAAISSKADGEAVLFFIILFLFFLVGAIILFKVAIKKKANVIEFDREGITKKDKKYLYEDIDDISWSFGIEGTYVTDSLQALAVSQARKKSGVVFITYGNKSVALISGLKENETRRAFEVLHNAMDELSETRVP